MSAGDGAPRHPEGAVDVATAADLEAAARSLDGAREIAVDAESDSMHAFRARLCFVQLASDEQVFLLDTLVPEVRVQRLAPLFADPARTKFFHAAGGDLTYLAEAGVRVRGLFDTHRAATLLGVAKVGLADLVRQELGVELPKAHQQADFSLRPLAPGVRAYIADDVRYLCEVGRRMMAACREKDILEETLLECVRLEDEARERPEPGEGAPRVPRGALDRASWRLTQAAASELHRLRLAWGEERNVPVGKVLSRAAILDLALARPTDLSTVVKKGNLRRALVQEHGAELLAVLRRVELQAASGALPEASGADAAKDPGRRRREEALRAFRAEQAAARGVTPSVVLPNALIDDLLEARPRDVEALARLPYVGAKRTALYGAAIVELLQRNG